MKISSLLRNIFLFASSCWVISTSALASTSASYTPHSTSGRLHNGAPKPLSTITQRTVLSMSGGFFDNLGKFMNNDENSEKGDGKSINSNSRPFQEKGLEEDNLSKEEIQVIQEMEEEYPGNSLIFRIKAKKMKIGGLRLWVFLNLMGQLNTPEPKSWKANQTDEKILEMYYKDTTGAIIIHFHETLGVSVYRFGSSPSMDYMMTESTILLGILDELDKIVKEGDIKVEDRLLVLEEPGDAIEKSRELLSFA